MSCGINDGISIVCDDLKRVGGVKKDAFLFNLSDLSTYTFLSGYVSALNFDVYGGLYQFSSRKQSHSGGFVPQSQDPGGNKFFQHDVLIKMFPGTAAGDDVLEDLLVSEVGVILETNNREFLLYGQYNGLEQISGGGQNSGQATASDVGYTINLQGEEQFLPFRLSVDGTGTDYDATKALIESYVL